MTRPLVLGRVPKAPTPAPVPPWRRWTDPLVLAAIGALLVGAAWTTNTLQRQPPAESSADVGFARDMADHHGQAVELAELVRTRTDDPAIRLLATDIALTQQAQIGQMRGWLEAWDRSLTSTAPAMAWMSHGGTGPMPGMATQDEISQLRRSSGPQADEQFLRLMIRHHRGGLLMAASALQLADEPDVRSLARAIRDGQFAEIEAMQALLAGLGAAPETEAITMDTRAGSDDEGSLGDSLRRFAPAVVTIIPLAWLILDDRARRRTSAR